MLLIFVTLGFVLVTYILNQMRKPKNYPPGPPFIPIVGHFYQIKKLSKECGGQILAYSKLSKIYNTDVLGLKFGKECLVVVSSYHLVKRVLTEDAFLGRPDNYFIKLRSMGKKRGITSNDGEVWRIQRHFLSKNFRNLGFGKDEMSKLIKKEVESFLEILPGANGPIQMILSPSVVNIFWYLASGSSISRDNPRILKLLELLKNRALALDMSGGLLNIFPWLRFIIPKQIGYQAISTLNAELRNFFKEIIDQHYETTGDVKDDLIHLYIEEIKAGQNTFAEDELIMILMDLFIAGALTTSTSLDFAFMMMVLRPDIQEKIKTTLDEAYDKNQRIEYSERHSVPYVEAFLTELLRFFPITPIIGPRRTLQEVELDGYTIPKGTTVLTEVYSIHFDESHWKDPHNFRPERFLDEDGKLIHDDYVIPFGLGKRRCLGEVLARNCLFTYFSEVVRKYQIKLHPESNIPSMTPKQGVVNTPKPYLAQFITR